jgi:hypothetical protein
MQASNILIMVIAMLFVAHLTLVTGFPSQNDDEPRFTLREVMEAMMNKREGEGEPPVKAPGRWGGK